MTRRARALALDAACLALMVGLGLWTGSLMLKAALNQSDITRAATEHARW